MLSAHDDNALEALASKGLVRRARRDFDAGLASVKQRDETSAAVTADGQEVSIDKRGPKEAKCDCPADGVCRHILLTVIALRETREAGAPVATPMPAQPEEAPAQSAAADIRSMTQAQLEKFAGADWTAAIAMAESAKDAKITSTGTSCTVDLEGGAASVTFIAGGIKNAAFKGPKARKRMLVAAAAIVLRTSEGVKLERSDTESTEAEETLSQAFLQEAADALVRAVRMTLNGAPLVAAELLFDIGISARVESAPRLTSHFRILARQARLAEKRDIGFEPEAFLAEAARTRALIEALKTGSDDPILTGSLRRDYQPCAAIDLWFLGASRWRSETGARGLTLFAYDAGNRRWLSATFARAAGQDPTFDPRQTYHAPIWGADSPVNLMGNLWHVPHPLISKDGAIAPTLAKRPTKAHSANPGGALEQTGAMIADWRQLRADLAGRFGSGLRRRTTALPALLSPARYGNLEFDELGQTLELELYDRSGDVISLSLSADANDLAKRLRNEGGRHRMLLVEAICTANRPMYRPVALLAERSEGLAVINLDLDQWQRLKFAVPALNLPSISSRNAAAAPAAIDPVRDIASRTLVSAAAAASNMIPADMTKLAQSADTIGLATLARSLDHLRGNPDARSAMATAYLAAEIQAALIWS
jgi:hypothetical protein